MKAIKSFPDDDKNGDDGDDGDDEGGVTRAARYLRSPQERIINPERKARRTA